MGFRKIGQPQRPSDAELYIGYGVASWRAGELNQAREALEQAFEWGSKSRNMVQLNTGYEVPEALFDAIVRVHKKEVPFGARELWYDVLAQEHPILVRALQKANSTRPETNE